ncbi:MAG: SufD family Fe-S cluster assembly protein, partial [Chloroflexi bacterium]|nr:SufD family Fe-S cluster assembly protein [Chloroflexota bacterium]
MRDVKSQPESLRNIEEKAKAAANKKAAFGEDINLNDFNNSSYNHDYQKDLSNLPAETKRKMLDIGVNADDTTQRSGTFIQVDNTPIHSTIEQEGIDLMPLSEALEKYSWLPDYMWKAVAVDSDKYTAHVELHRNNGYFIRALPGAKSVYPIQSCLYIGKAGLAQNVHNIIIAEEGSELHIITGCAM